MKRRLTAIFLCLCLLFTLLPATALAEGETDGVPSPAESALCEHHPQHDGSCGYTEGSAGTPCAHAHSGDCYAPVTNCVHTHTADCFPAAPADGAGNAPEDPAAPAEPAACAHVCSAESGCVTNVLDCHHTHDAACGYVPAVEGTPCGYVCEICRSQEGGEAEETAPEGTGPEETAPTDPEPTEPEPEPESTAPDPEAVCLCAQRCTENSVNADCPVCSAGGADLSACLGAVPAAALTAAPARASGHGPHKVCVNSSHDECTHTAITDWQPLNQDVVQKNDKGIGYVIPAGNYYLDGDVKIETEDSLFILSGEVVICLNGHKLDFDAEPGLDQLKVQAAITLCDCQTGENTANVNGEDVTVSGGYLTGLQLTLNTATANLYKCNIIGSSPSPVQVLDGSTLNMYSNANISHNRNQDYNDTYIIYVHMQSTFNMYGGTIANNTLLSSAGNAGGGVSVAGNSIFNMYGGEISGNRANAGGGVYVTGVSSFSLSGGRITGNEANSGDGGGVLIENGVFYLNSGEISGNKTADGSGGGIALKGMAIATISGGEIRGNTAHGVGGGIYVPDSGSQLTISGDVSISSNCADGIDGRTSGQGGGMYVANGGRVTMTGGTIQSNSAKSGGGVYMAGGELTLNNVGLEYNKGYIGNPASPIDGSAVYMAGGELTMNGGAITGHNEGTDTGTVYMTGGTFHLNGGSITGNNNQSGSVYLKGGTFRVSGSAQVTGNGSGNIVLPTGGSGVITIGGPLSSGARLGVTAEESRTITSGWSAQMPGGDPGAYFTSDTDGLIAVLEGGEAVLKAGFAIKLETNGGTVNSGSVSGYKVGQGAMLPTDVTRPGYDFCGWYEQKDFSGTRIYAVAADATGDKTFYAKWELATYTVTLDPNGGTIAEGKNVTSYTYGETKELPSSLYTTRTGYIFLGWFVDDDTEVYRISDTDYGDKTFTAQWHAINYNVVFDANGGSGGMPPQTIAYDKDAYIHYNQFTRTGYEFVEWNTEKDGRGTPYAGGQKVKNLSAINGETITLYAQWKLATYEVTLETNGGIIAEGKDITSYAYGESPELPAGNEITRTGYTFQGWKDDASGRTVTKISSSDHGAKTFTAQWEPITYTVAFDANGGEGSMSNQTFTYDAEQTLNASGFTQTGHDFAGWSTTEGGAVVYADQQEVSNLTATSGAIITLYAQWEPSTYAVVLAPNEGTIADGKNVTSYTYGTGAALPTAEDITRTGYQFEGWYEDSSFSGSPVTEITAAEMGNKTYYAKWVKVWTVTVTAEGGGTVSGGGTYEEDSTVTVTATPNGGYRFARWTENGVQVSTSTSYAFTLTGDRSLTAEFARNSNSSGASIATYPVIVADTEHGAVTVSHKEASRNTPITITVTPDAGYALAELNVTGSGGDAVELRDQGGGVYTFPMPSARVTVAAVFTETAPERLPFTDVPETFWAYGEIAWAYESGYVNGVTAAAFSPNGTISRQQIWMILARLSGCDPADMAAARAWAMESGISDGTNPGGAVTRQQLAALLYRFAQGQGYDVSVGEDTNILSYTDAFDVAEYAVPALQWACGAGILNGTADGRLNPQGTATRAQAAVMLQRFCALDK